jgi:hypothetical protein
MGVEIQDGCQMTIKEPRGLPGMQKLCFRPNMALHFHYCWSRVTKICENTAFKYILRIFFFQDGRQNPTWPPYFFNHLPYRNEHFDPNLKQIGPLYLN